MSVKAWVFGALGVIALGIWTAAASHLFMFFAGLWGQITDPVTRFTAWWVYLFSPYAAFPAIKLMLAASAALPTIALALPLVIAARNRTKGGLRRSWGGPRGVKPGVTQNHGTARWPTERELRKAFGKRAGLLIGASDKSTSPIFLSDDLNSGPLHSVYISGSRGFKSVSAISRLWMYHGPRVVFDPKSEIGPVMTEALESTGHTVKTIGLDQSTFNVFDWIDVRHPEADVHINTAVEHIYDESAAHNANPQQADNPFWSQWGRAIVACLMAHMLYDPNCQDTKTPKLLRTGLAMPQGKLLEKLKEIYTTSYSKMARDLAAGLIENQAPETWTGIYSNAFNATKWLSVESYASMVSGSSMRTADILSDDMVVLCNYRCDPCKPHRQSEELSWDHCLMRCTRPMAI